MHNIWPYSTDVFCHTLATIELVMSLSVSAFCVNATDLLQCVFDIRT